MYVDRGAGHVSGTGLLLFSINAAWPVRPIEHRTAPSTRELLHLPCFWLFPQAFLRVLINFSDEFWFCSLKYLYFWMPVQEATSCTSRSRRKPAPRPQSLSITHLSLFQALGNTTLHPDTWLWPVANVPFGNCMQKKTQLIQPSFQSHKIHTYLFSPLDSEFHAEKGDKRTGFEVMASPLWAGGKSFVKNKFWQQSFAFS